MTSDGKNGMQIDYNALDLLGKVSSGGTTLVKYSYLADGTRIAALKPDGRGLVQRGSLTYRRGTDGSLSFEGADITGGRFTAGQVIWHVTDHLGSVVGILRSGGANPFEYNVFNAFGTKTRTQFSAPFTPEASLRFAFTGKEDQSVEFNVPYTDFGARHYSPTLTRWLTPDPLSEKYYGISPYAYCGGDPVNSIDPDGRFPETIWDVASLALGIKSFCDNVNEGNVGGAIADGVGIAYDAVAVVVPFVPGGVGAGLKALRAADNAADVAKAVNRVDNVADLAETAKAIDNAAETAAKAGVKATSRGNLRKNMIKATGEAKEGMEAHHTLPVKFQNKFSKAGIDINAPENGVWLEGHSHKSSAYQYNKAWKGFFKKFKDAGTTPSQVEIYQFRDNLMKTMYGN